MFTLFYAKISQKYPIQITWKQTIAIQNWMNHLSAVLGWSWQMVEEWYHRDLAELASPCWADLGTHAVVCQILPLRLAVCHELQHTIAMWIQTNLRTWNTKDYFKNLLWESRLVKKLLAVHVMWSRGWVQFVADLVVAVSESVGCELVLKDLRDLMDLKQVPLAVTRIVSDLTREHEV